MGKIFTLNFNVMAGYDKDELLGYLESLKDRYGVTAELAEYNSDQYFTTVDYTGTKAALISLITSEFDQDEDPLEDTDDEATINFINKYLK